MKTELLSREENDVADRRLTLSEFIDGFGGWPPNPRYSECPECGRHLADYMGGNRYVCWYCGAGARKSNGYTYILEREREF